MFLCCKYEVYLCGSVCMLFFVSITFSLLSFLDIEKPKCCEVMFTTFHLQTPLSMMFCSYFCLWLSHLCPLFENVCNLSHFSLTGIKLSPSRQKKLLVTQVRSWCKHESLEPSVDNTLNLNNWLHSFSLEQLTWDLLLTLKEQRHTRRVCHQQSVWASGPTRLSESSVSILKNTYSNWTEWWPVR